MFSGTMKIREVENQPANPHRDCGDNQQIDRRAAGGDDDHLDGRCDVLRKKDNANSQFPLPISLTESITTSGNDASRRI